MADIGTTLREARMRSRIDIGEVEAGTKIRAKYLRALENEEWDLLPGPVYVKSFLRTYGDYLGLDSRMLVEEFKRRYERPVEHEPRPVATRGRERRRQREPRAGGPLVPPWAVIGVVLVGVVVALYAIGSNSGTSTPKATEQAGISRRHSHHRAHGAHAPQPKTSILAARPASVTLQLVPTSRIWVCLVDGAGKELIPGQIFLPGETIPSQTAHKLLLTLGNASVQMKVNGKTVAVPTATTPIGLQLTPTATSPLSPSQQPTCG